MRFLHLGTPAVQGSMKVSKPFEIHLEYQQRMMGWLLFTDLDQVSHKHAMQLGLGAASLTKFCYQHLKMRTIAIELNPQVITTCRQWFNLPKDNEKLQVVLGDAAEIASDDQWRGKIDALQVDLYDQAAASPVIDSEDFYRDCRSLLTHEGCMAVNLFGQASNYDESLKKITTAFGKDAVWAFKPTSAGNAIVLALRTPRVFDANTLQAQAQTIQTRWPLPAKKWLKTLAPISRAMTLDRSSLS
ncbi:spermidine synthase [Limnohabitans sp. Rim8]|uniref:spermidine synthase n=1 Tax=Limnohabitans sp. Rim8 TaxID=1100718 RepID=UPI0018EE51AE|nr:spermidine synthase [Limnohabitans sp. Rim8]